MGIVGKSHGTLGFVVKRDSECSHRRYRLLSQFPLGCEKGRSSLCQTSDTVKRRSGLRLLSDAQDRRPHQQVASKKQSSWYIPFPEALLEQLL